MHARVLLLAPLLIAGCVTKSSGGQTLLAPTKYGAWSVQVDSTSVYWADNDNAGHGAILKVPLSGGAVLGKVPVGGGAVVTLVRE